LVGIIYTLAIGTTERERQRSEQQSTLTQGEREPERERRLAREGGGVRKMTMRRERERWTREVLVQCYLCLLCGLEYHNTNIRFYNYCTLHTVRGKYRFQIAGEAEDGLYKQHTTG
jgi:ribosomal protein L44E